MGSELLLGQKTLYLYSELAWRETEIGVQRVAILEQTKPLGNFAALHS